MITGIASGNRIVRSRVVHCAMALMFLLAGGAFARPSDEDLAPQSYSRIPRFDAYQKLNAKCCWLNEKIGRHERAIRTLRRQLFPESTAEQKEIIEERIHAQQQVVDEANAELKTLGGPLGGPRTKAQEALVKKNVQAWIGALRAKASTYRDRAKAEAKAAAAANNKQDAARHRAAEAEDQKVANQAEKTAGELAFDLGAAKL